MSKKMNLIADRRRRYASAMLQGSQTPIAWDDTWQSMSMLAAMPLRYGHARSAPVPAARLTNAMALNWVGARDEDCARAELLLVIPSSNERRVR
jgi:hypothetical protein